MMCPQTAVWSGPKTRTWKFVLSVFAVTVSLVCRGATDLQGLQDACDAGWESAMTFRSSKTGLLYECHEEEVRSSKGCVGGMFHWGKGLGYGKGMEDCALNCGTALSALVDRYALLKDDGTREDAAKIARGVLNLAKLHGVRGFVARGICPDDGKTICSLSSRDQYTHWVHGLWRYAGSPMADPSLVDEYRALVTDVARFMEEKVTRAHGWNFGLADGGKDPLGLCTMWGADLHPHEHARLPMIYLAAYLATGNGHWLSLYEEFIDTALDRTLTFTGAVRSYWEDRIPCYSLYQANASLELVLSYEKNPVRRAKIMSAMKGFADVALGRVKESLRRPEVSYYGMCWDGELLMTILMARDRFDPGTVHPFLAQTVRRADLNKSGVCRVAHVMAAYWRTRALGDGSRSATGH